MAAASVWKKSSKTVRIGSHEVKVMDHIGAGNFADVFLVKENNASEEVFALKRLVVGGDNERLRIAQREVDMLKAVNGHRNIVRLIDASYPTATKGVLEEILVLMEYCDGGSVLNMLTAGPINTANVMRIFCNTLEAVAHMHQLQPPVTHRDIKVENILLASTGVDSGQFKLTDFGSATQKTFIPRPGVSSNDMLLWQEDIDRNTTLSYRAPEQIDVYQRQPIDERVDIWALGCLLFKLAYAQDAFMEKMEIIGNRLRTPAPAVVANHPPEIMALIKFCLVTNPEARPSAADVIAEVIRLGHGRSLSTAGRELKNKTPSLPSASPVPRSFSPPEARGARIRTSSSSQALSTAAAPAPASSRHVRASSASSSQHFASTLASSAPLSPRGHSESMQINVTLPIDVVVEAVLPKDVLKKLVEFGLSVNLSMPHRCQLALLQGTELTVWQQDQKINDAPAAFVKKDSRSVPASAVLLHPFQLIVALQNSDSLEVQCLDLANKLRVAKCSVAKIVYWHWLDSYCIGMITADGIASIWNVLTPDFKSSGNSPKPTGLCALVDLLPPLSAPTNFEVDTISKTNWQVVVAKPLRNNNAQQYHGRSQLYSAEKNGNQPLENTLCAAFLRVPGRLLLAVVLALPSKECALQIVQASQDNANLPPFKARRLRLGSIDSMGTEPTAHLVVLQRLQLLVINLISDMIVLDIETFATLSRVSLDGGEMHLRSSWRALRSPLLMLASIVPHHGQHSTEQEGIWAVDSAGQVAVIRMSSVQQLAAWSSSSSPSDLPAIQAVLTRLSVLSSPSSPASVSSSAPSFADFSQQDQFPSETTVEPSNESLDSSLIDQVSALVKSKQWKDLARLAAGEALDSPDIVENVCDVVWASLNDSSPTEADQAKLELLTTIVDESAVSLTPSVVYLMVQEATDEKNPQKAEVFRSLIRKILKGGDDRKARLTDTPPQLLAALVRCRDEFSVSFAAVSVAQEHGEWTLACTTLSQRQLWLALEALLKTAEQSQTNLHKQPGIIVAEATVDASRFDLCQAYAFAVIKSAFKSSTTASSAPAIGTFLHAVIEVMMVREKYKEGKAIAVSVLDLIQSMTSSAASDVRTDWQSWVVSPLHTDVMVAALHNKESIDDLLVKYEMFSPHRVAEAARALHQFQVALRLYQRARDGNAMLGVFVEDLHDLPAAFRVAAMLDTPDAWRYVGLAQHNAYSANNQNEHNQL